MNDLNYRPCRQIDDLKTAVEMKDAMLNQLEAEKQYAVEEKTEPLQQEIQQLKRSLDNRNAQLQVSTGRVICTSNVYRVIDH